MTLSCTDGLVTFLNLSPYDWRTLGYHFATDHRLVGDKAPINHRLIADQSQTGRLYIAKIPALFVVKPMAIPSETDLRLTQDLSETSRRTVKPLSDQISRGQSSVHAQRQLATNLVRRQVGDLLVTSTYSETFDTFLRLSILLVAKRSHRSRKLCVTGFRTQGFFIRTAKNLIRLGGCPG